MKFLQEDHPFQSKRSWFDGEEEHGNPPRIMNGTTIVEHLKDFMNVWGKSTSKKRKQDESKEMLKKRSIFFQLPYWKVSTFLLFI